MDRDADGQLYADPVRFPDGIKGVADYGTLGSHKRITMGWITSAIHITNSITLTTPCT